VILWNVGIGWDHESIFFPSSVRLRSVSRPTNTIQEADEKLEHKDKIKINLPVLTLRAEKHFLIRFTQMIPDRACSSSTAFYDNMSTKQDQKAPRRCHALSRHLKLFLAINSCPHYSFPSKDVWRA